MNRTIHTSRASGFRRAARAPLALAVVGALALGAQSASAFEFSNGEFTGSINTTLSYGASMRMQDRDDNLLAKSHFDPTLRESGGPPVERPRTPGMRTRTMSVDP